MGITNSTSTSVLTILLKTCLSYRCNIWTDKAGNETRQPQPDSRAFASFREEGFNQSPSADPAEIYPVTFEKARSV